MGGAGVRFLEGQGSHTRVILILREYIWNGPAVSPFLPGFEDTASLGSLPCRMVYPPLPLKETEGSYQGGNRRTIDHPTRRITKGAGIIKGCEDKRDRGSIPDTFP